MAVVGTRLRRAGHRARARTRPRTSTSALLVLAALAMVWALVTHDFSVSYVAQVGSRSTPLFYTIISLWGALEGSILFWGLVLAGFSAAAVWRGTRGTHGAANADVERLMPYATAILLGIGAFFYLLLVMPANPFRAVCPGAGRRPGAESAAPESHSDGRASAAPVSRLRGDVGAVRVRDGRADRRREGRRVDSAHAALDDGGVDVPHARRSSPACGGRTKCSAGAGTGRGIRSRTRPFFPGSRRRRSSTRRWSRSGAGCCACGTSA